MNISDAAYAVVHDYPGGSESLGPRVGIDPAVLRNKVNQANTTHHLRLDESVRLQGVSGDHRICRAMNEELGYLPPIPRVDFAVSDSSLLETYTRLMAELGDFSGKFHVALSDGNLTMKEVAALRTEMLEFFAAGEELLNRASQIAEG